jgi:hypothetical protein
MSHMVITPHILHHLVLDIVGRKLSKFESSHQLVQSICDVLIGMYVHWNLRATSLSYIL